MHFGRSLPRPLSLLAAVCTASAVATVAAPMAGAAPPPHVLRLLSTPLSGALPATFAGASADGRRVFFTTTEAITGTGDADADTDLYARDADGTLALLSTGGSAGFAADFSGASADGRRVFFTTAEPIDGTDTDTALDVYARNADGSLTLVSGPSSGAFDAYFAAASADGRRVFFETAERIDVTDADTAVDVYAGNADGSLTLISTPGSAPGEDASLRGIAADGSCALFETTEGIDGADADSALDVYARESTGTLRLISTPDGGDAYFVGASADASRVFFETTAPIAVTGDADTANDVYAREAGGTLELVSTAHSGAGLDASFAGVSEDGGRVFFTTGEAIAAAGDGDARTDLYVRGPGDALELISTGSSGTNEDVTFSGAAADGRRVIFITREKLAGDTDNARDLFAREPGGGLTLISTPRSGIGQDAYFSGASADGDRVFFATSEQVADTGDADLVFDVYERDLDGTLRLVTLGTSAGMSLRAVSDDGLRVAFTTAEAIAGTGDADTAVDLYEATIPAPSFTGAASIAGTPARDATLTCVPGTVVGELVATTIAWLRDGAAIPGANLAAYRIGAADLNHTLACRVTAANPIGSATQYSPTVMAPELAAPRDTGAPRATITAPSCAKKSRAACRRLLASVRAWRTLAGTATDPAPSSGLARVEVSLVRKDGKRCFAYDGQRFARAACPAAAKRFIAAKLAAGRWSLAIRRLRAGTYVVRVRAIDRAGNATAAPATRTLRLR